MQTPIFNMMGSLGRNAAAPSRIDGDAELLRRVACSRDEEAFSGLLQRHGGLVWGVCRSLLFKDVDAEDAFQATFVALFQNASTIKVSTSVAPWLHGTATRIARKVRLATSRRMRRERNAAKLESNSSMVSDTMWNALHLAVHLEISRLPTVLRDAFVLCVMQGIPHKVAAMKLGVPVGTLSARVSRARDQLLQRLTRQGMTPALMAVVTCGTATFASVVPPSICQNICGHVASGFSSVPGHIINLAKAGGGVSMSMRILLIVMMGALTLIATNSIGWADAFDPSTDEKQKPQVVTDKKESPFVVFGKVTDETGKPLEGVDINANCGMGSLFHTGTVKTNAEGKYRLPFHGGMSVSGTPLGIGTQVATISPFLKGWYETQLHGQGNLLMSDQDQKRDRNNQKGYAGVVLPNKPYEINFTLTRAATIKGRLVNEFGTPIPNQSICLTGEVLPPSCSVLGTMVSDEKGRFQFEDVPVWQGNAKLQKKLQWYFTVRVHGVRHELRTDAFSVVADDAKPDSEVQELTIGSEGDTQSVRLGLKRKVVKSKER